MPRRAARTDANQKSIVKALRKCGCSVHITSNLGEGFPDIVVGYRDNNFLMEIKDGDKPPSQRKLTHDEREFFETWKGDVSIVNNIDEALQAVGIKL